MKPIVADTDILVYKIGKVRGWGAKRFHPIYYGDFVYKKGVPVPSVNICPKFNTKTDEWYISKGYHSLIGYYNAINYASIYNFGGCKYDIGVFIIPKGTVYYINHAYEVVSETLVYLYKYSEHLHGF